MTDPMFVFDFDSHYYEQPDAFSRYIDEEYRPRSVRFETGPNNENFMYIDNELCREYPDMYPPLAGDIGVDDFYEALSSGKLDHHLPATEKKPEWFSAAPRAWLNREARLELLNAQGVHASLLLPSFAVEVDRMVADKPDLAQALFRAYNRWQEDEWGYDYAGRLFAVPQIRFYDIEQGMDELNRVIARGARAVNLHIGPTNRESIASTKFDRFWERVSETDTLVTMHLGAANHAEAMAELWGPETAPAHVPQYEWTPFLFLTAFGDRPIMDMVGSLIFWNLFGRYPHLKIVSVENGGGAWLEYLLKALDKAVIHARNGRWPGGVLPDGQLPSEVLRSNLNVVPFPEDSLSRVVEIVGADRALLGSDYPHPEGLPAPLKMLERIRELPEVEQRQVMGLNAARLMGLTDSDVSHLVEHSPVAPLEEALNARA